MPGRNAIPALFACALGLAACSGPQSALAPAGEAAESLWHLTVIMTVGSVIITLLVTVAIALAFWRPDWRPSRRFWLFGGGVALPVAVLSALILYSTATGHSMRGPVPEGSPAITATGHMWWWEIEYRRPDGRPSIVTANEIVIPSNTRSEILLKAADVIHSFWAPTLAGKVDMIPGRTNRIVLEPRTPGVYRGQCAEFCGAMHAEMAFSVRVLPPEAYEQWLAAQEQPAVVPVMPFLRRGAEVFIEQGCGACHQVRGLDGAAGRLGPDLTHYASRPAIAAGLLKNNLGNTAAWIASSQHLKPGNRMPSFNLSGEDLRAVSAYLESLR